MRAGPVHLAVSRAASRSAPLSAHRLPSYCTSSGAPGTARSLTRPLLPARTQTMSCVKWTTPNIIWDPAGLLCYSRTSDPAVLLCYSRTSDPAGLLCYSRTSDPAGLLGYSRTSDPAGLLCYSMGERAQSLGRELVCKMPGRIPVLLCRY